MDGIKERWREGGKKIDGKKKEGGGMEGRKKMDGKKKEDGQKEGRGNKERNG